MLVHNDRLGPRKPLAHINHRPGEFGDLGAVQRKGRTGGDKSGQLGVGVASGGDVADDPVKSSLAQTLAIDTAAYIGE